MKAVNAVTTSWPGLHVDRPSFSAVAESELDAVHRYLLFLTGDRAVAEDLTGETFEKAFRSWRRFDPRRGTVRAWLCRIARSTALDHFRSEERRRRREARYARDLPEAEEPGLGPGATEAALARLSPAEREGLLDSSEQSTQETRGDDARCRRLRRLTSRGSSRSSCAGCARCRRLRPTMSASACARSASRLSSRGSGIGFALFR